MLRKGDEPIRGYRLVQFLGRGAFGEVWRVTGPGGTSAALKFIDLGGKQGLKEYRAIQRVKEIRHAHLLPIYAFWMVDQYGDVLDDAELAAWDMDGSALATAQGSQVAQPRRPATLVVAMLLGDRSLSDRLEDCLDESPKDAALRGIPLEELVGYLEDAAKGIDFLNSPRHDLGEGPVSLQHCDIKPQNILLVGNSALVCDFGLARVLGDQHRTKTAMAGSPAYMAPEVIKYRKPSRTTDQYSLAIAYFELRTGKLPFDHESYAAVLDAHLRGNLDLSPLPDAERAIILKATAIEPEARYGSALEMVRAIGRTIERSDDSAFPLTDTRPPARDTSIDVAATSAHREVAATLAAPVTSTVQSARETAYDTRSSVESGEQEEAEVARPAVVAPPVQEDAPVSAPTGEPKHAEARPAVAYVTGKRGRNWVTASLIAVGIIGVAAVGLLAYFSPEFRERLGFGNGEKQNGEQQKVIVTPEPARPIERKPIEKESPVVIKKLVEPEPPVRETVVLQFTPADATVTLDDNPLALDDEGKVTLRQAAANAMTITATRDGYRDYAATKSASQWKEHGGRIQLEPIPVDFAREGMELLQKEQFSDAEKMLVRAVAAGKNSAEVLLALAKAQRANGRAGAAIDTIGKALAANPPLSKRDVAEAHYVRGIAHGNINQPQAAIDELRKAAEFDARFAKDFVAQAAQFHVGLMNLALESGNRDKAVSLADAALADVKDDGGAKSKILLKRGEAYVGLEKFDAAIDDLRGARQFDEKIAEQVRVPLANALRQQARLATEAARAKVATAKPPDAAIAALTESIELLPNDGVYAARGTAYNAREEFAKAIADFDEALRLDDKNVAAWHNRGYAFNMLGNFRKGIESFTKAIDLQPENHATAYNNRGYAWLQLRDFDKAVDDYTEAVRQSKTDSPFSSAGLAAAYRGRAGTAAARGDHAQSVGDLQKAIDLATGDKAALEQELTIALARAGRKTDAIERANRAVESAPKDAAALSTRGFVYYLNKEYQKASDDYTAALARNSKNAEVYYRRGILHLDQQDTSPAIFDLGQAIGFQKDYVEAYRSRARAYELRGGKGDADLAKADREKAKELDAAADSQP